MTVDIFEAYVVWQEQHIKLMNDVKRGVAALTQPRQNRIK